LEEEQREGERERRETRTRFPTKYFERRGDDWVFKNRLKERLGSDLPSKE